MLVKAEPIRNAVIRCNECGTSYSEICRRLGWYINSSGYWPRKAPDVIRLKRRLGMKAIVDKDKFIYTKSLSYDIAIEIIRAIDCDPIDFGL